MSRRPFRSAALGHLSVALVATLAAVSGAVLSAGAVRAQDFTMKFATLTINDVQHEFIKMYKTELEKATISERMTLGRDRMPRDTGRQARGHRMD